MICSLSALIKIPFEQLKLDVDQQKANVKLIGYADYPNLGPTHSELNGKSLMKLLKNTKSFYPKTLGDVKKDVMSAHKLNGPCFISLKKVK